MEVRRSIAAAAIAAVASLGVVEAKAQGVAGPYLAATTADRDNEYNAAADYYAQALVRDPGNRAILQNGLVTMIAAGRFDAAETLARKLQDREPTNQVSALVRLGVAMRDGDFARAEAIAKTEDFHLNPLFAGLLEGWAAVGQGDYEKAQTAFDLLNQNDTLKTYGQYHKALALALAGDFATAATLLEGTDDTPLHISRTAVIAHIAALSQSDQTERALEVADTALSDGYADPEMTALRDRMAAGEKIEFDIIDSAADGAAMAYAILGSALARDNSDRFALVYARLATMISPEFDEARILSAEVLQRQQQYDLAIEAFARIEPTSPWYISAEIGRAEALYDADKADRAIEALSILAREKPGELSIFTSLGDIQRASENFEEAAVSYTKAIDLIGEEQESHWVLYYYRGITFERTDQWPKAEADFRRALELKPDQPRVLNYLGYSLVELRRNFEEAQEMIEKAVEQRPNDGYITDSLGWVLYRVGKYEEAVPHMERAVELVPVDPIINDHLGDVLWKVGRKLEAEFQWRRALSFEPEEEDAIRIRRKLEVGLDAVLREEELKTATPGPTAQDG